MTNRLEPIAVENLEFVEGGTLNGTPLGSLSFFISASNDSSRSVAKSFDVLTLSSPVVGVARVAHEQAPPKIMGTPVPRGRARAASSGDDRPMQRTVTVGDLIVARKRGRR
jgi:hypothetical protein